MQSTLIDTLGYHCSLVGRTQDANPLLVDIKMPVQIILVTMQGTREETIATIEACRNLAPSCPVVALRSFEDYDSMKATVEAGADDVLVMPIALERLKLCLRNMLKMQQLEKMAQIAHVQPGSQKITALLGYSDAFKSTLERAKQAKNISTSLLITGESGCGKLALARSLADGDYVQCFAGHEQGLPVLKSGTVIIKAVDRVGKQADSLIAWLRNQPKEVRVIATARQINDIPSALAGLFLPVIRVPSLHERREDIQGLADYWLRYHAAMENKNIYGLTEKAQTWLISNPWPDNIRELSQTLWRAVMMSDRELLDLDDLHAALKQSGPRIASLALDRGVANRAVMLDANGKVKRLHVLEGEAIRFAVEHNHGCMAKAARALGIGRSTLYRKLDSIGGMGEEKAEAQISRANHTMRPTMTVSSTVRSYGE